MLRRVQGGQILYDNVACVMCRSIKVLRHPDTPATAPEISAAALQFVRKVSGFRKPSRANQDAFEAARSEEHTSELQSPCNLVCRLLLEKKKKENNRGSWHSIAGVCTTRRRRLAHC